MRVSDSSGVVCTADGFSCPSCTTLYSSLMAAATCDCEED